MTLAGVCDRELAAGMVCFEVVNYGLSMLALALGGYFVGTAGNVCRMSACPTSRGMEER